jgi:hypothetical protein
MLEVYVGKRVTGAEEIAWETLSQEELASLASTPALFGDARKFLLRGPLGGPRAEEFLEWIEVFVESPHTFVFEEEKLLKKERGVVAKAGATLQEVPVQKKARGFDPYGLTTALGSRDKRRVWLGLEKALREGESPEALAGLLAWKARQMRDVPLSRRIVSLYHDSHRGVGDLALLLERFALTL